MDTSVSITGALYYGHELTSLCAVRHGHELTSLCAVTREAHEAVRQWSTNTHGTAWHRWSRVPVQCIRLFELRLLIISCNRPLYNLYRPLLNQLQRVLYMWTSALHPTYIRPTQVSVYILFSLAYYLFGGLGAKRSREARESTARSAVDSGELGGRISAKRSREAHESTARSAVDSGGWGDFFLKPMPKKCIIYSFLWLTLFRLIIVASEAATGL
jgi:hypothetical protein